MENGLYMDLAAQTGLKRRLDVISNNVANMDTDGFKRQRVLFETEMQKASNDIVPETPGAAREAYPVDRGTLIDATSGELKSTGNPLDVAIEGDGFFAVQGEDGPLYTRDGGFRLDAQGGLVHAASGRPVLDDGGAPIVVPPDAGEVEIASDGTISTAGGQVLGALGANEFAQAAHLEPRGDNVYQATDGSGAAQPAGDARFVQGAVEGSNVNPMREITDMIEVQRAYQRAQSMIDKTDQSVRAAIEGLAGGR